MVQKKQSDEQTPKTEASGAKKNAAKAKPDKTAAQPRSEGPKVNAEAAVKKVVRPAPLKVSTPTPQPRKPVAGEAGKPAAPKRAAKAKETAPARLESAQGQPVPKSKAQASAADPKAARKPSAGKKSSAAKPTAARIPSASLAQETPPLAGLLATESAQRPVASGPASRQAIAPPPTAAQSDARPAPRRAAERSAALEEPPHHGVEPDLPGHLERTRLVLMVRDPQWLYAYWEIAAEDRERHQIGRPHGAPPLILRIYDLGTLSEPAQTEEFFDVTVVTDVSGWYVDVGRRGGHWRAALGYLDITAEFVPLAESNPVSAPSEGEIEWPDEEEAWGTPPVAETLKGGAAGVAEQPPDVVRRQRRRPGQTALGASERLLRPGASEQFLRPGASERLRPGASERAVPGSALMERRPPEIEVEKGFWLKVYTELIVYGATEPTARVTVQGHSISLRPDGTFTLRFALPDGEQVIPVRAVNADGDMERTITPIVTKRTD